MEIEEIAQILIYIHAVFGGLALLAGGIAIAAKKGRRLHKKSGVIFFYSMLLSALISLVVSLMPNHENPFLFSIGLFSTYLLLSGYRSLKFKNDTSGLRIDKLIAYVIVLIGLGMIVAPVIMLDRIVVVLAVFGLMGMIFGFRDIRLFRNKEKLKKSWLKLHLGNMIGGYIAAMSAFFVVNGILPGIWNWFAPGIVGSAFITYWMMKLNKNKKVGIGK